MIAFIGIYLFTLVLTELMSNNAAAALAFPMGYQLALSMDVSTMPFILAVLFGASSSFILPYGYQTNLMVYAARQLQDAGLPQAGPAGLPWPTASG